MTDLEQATEYFAHLNAEVKRTGHLYIVIARSDSVFKIIRIKVPSMSLGYDVDEDKHTVIVCDEKNFEYFFEIGSDRCCTEATLRHTAEIAVAILKGTTINKETTDERHDQTSN